MFRRIRLLYRLFFAIFYTLYIVGWTALRGWLLGTGKADAQRIRQGWARHLLYTVGLRVNSSGTPPDFPCIIMCNHRSYLDPIVLLRDVLDKAGIIFEEKRDFNRLVIKATATDGFQTLWSWHELYNSDVGNYVFIVIEKDGKPLSAKEGNFMLISTKDLKTGPRHVRWLKSIEVVKL